MNHRGAAFENEKAPVPGGSRFQETFGEEQEGTLHTENCSTSERWQEVKM